MTNSPMHKNQAGQPSDNGGHFAATQRHDDESVVLSAPRPQRVVQYSDLKPGDVIVGDDGSGRLTVKDIESSQVFGMMAIETNFGYLYVDAEESTTVAADDETYLQFNVTDVTEDQFVATWQAARGNLGIQGTYFTRDDADGLLSSDEDYDDVDGDQFWDAIQNHYNWTHLDDTLASAGNESIGEATAEIVEQLRRAQPKALATFADPDTGADLRIVAGEDDDETFIIVGTERSVTFRASADSTADELIGEAAQFWLDEDEG